MNIKYWEIWSGADSSACFYGEDKEYYELYRITANHLRERFPRIKIGAYGSGGFYSLNRIESDEEMKGYISFMQGFFSYVTSKEGSAPLDFFSWCCYTSSPEELALHAKYARNYLDMAGLRRTKSIICEYNTAKREGKPALLRNDLPSELVASLVMAQKSDADMMIYSSSDIYSKDNSLFTIDDYTTHHHYASYGVMRDFGKLYRLSTAIDTGDDHRKELYKLAAANVKEGALLLATRDFEGKLEIVFGNSPFEYCVVSKTLPDGTRGKGSVYRSKEIDITSGRLVLSVGKCEIYYISFFNR
jgi:hypothetical protein